MSPLIHRTPGGMPWFLKRPWGFVARARFEQIDTERRAWQRWCEAAEARIEKPHAQIDHFLGCVLAGKAQAPERAESVYEVWMPREQYDQIAAENGRLRGENERLREALTLIADGTCMIRSGPGKGERYIDTDAPSRIARTALASDETDASKETS